jgi:hypothetical protein
MSANPKASQHSMLKWKKEKSYQAQLKLAYQTKLWMN